jgi:Double zinc ribbon
MIFPPAFFGIESTGLTVAIDLFIVCCAVLYLALIWWTYTDARRRIADSTLVGSAVAGSLVPFIGTLVYLILRPAETLGDAGERDVEAEVARLNLYELEGRLCPHCDYPVQPDFLRCPSCLRRLKERCASCQRPLERAWAICPYCEADVPERPSRSRRSGRARRAGGRADTVGERDGRERDDMPARRDSSARADAGMRADAGTREGAPARGDAANGRSEREREEVAGGVADGRARDGRAGRKAQESDAGTAVLAAPRKRPAAPSER